MAAPADGKPILKIDVDDTSWQEFADSFMHYQQVLNEQPAAWANTNKGIKAAGTAFDDVEETFSKLVKASLDPKFSNPTSGVFTRVKKEAVETERSWRNIAKDIEKSSRNMVGLARSGLNFSSLSMFGIGGAVVGAVGGASVAAVNDLAAQNAQNRELGLQPGEAEAFNTVFGRAGGNDELLAKIAQAKYDPRQWKGLFAAGIGGDEITSKDPEQLAAEFLEKAGSKFKAMGSTGGTWAQSTGVTDFLNTLQLNKAGSYGAGDYAGMQQQYAQVLPKLAAQQKVLDDATAEQAKFAAAFAQTELEFEKAFVKLAPEFEQLATEAAGWVTGFADSKEFADDVQEFEKDVHGFVGAVHWGVKTLNDLMNGKLTIGQITSGNPEEPFHVDKDHPVGQITRDPSGHTRWAIEDWWDNLTGKGSSTTGTGTTATMDTVLDAIKQNESSGINGQTNPDTGAAGLYGIMPANYQRDHVDPMDPVAARAEAQKILASSLTKYHGNMSEALAAYDGFAGLDKDIAKYGPDWRAHIGEFQKSGETSAYLSKIERQGIDLSGMGGMPKNPFDDAKIIPYDDGNPDDNVGGFPVVPYVPTMPTKPKEGPPQGLDAISERLSKLLAEGGGSQFRKDDRTAQRIDRQGSQPYSPYSINVNVTTPAGSSTTITAGGLPQ
ncbi:hypothetical protein R75471_05522 [Paraburkholderia domus]|uniref:lytic transglycosylase domain-containing protein n=1 Tax=Paraburkholderia domus TaxID=2793075 RepID=UPI001B248606|nr:lytic transglycosylase domain-containing protein [Paraburkholderia domus]CAE6944085.1 hypothetical protein R75471_05522 [Paraburkholderia domus]